MPTENRPKCSAVVAGATGLVGGEVVRLLASNSGILGVRALTRRPLYDRERIPGVQECIVDFEHLEDQRACLEADVVFSALGTTIADAGSQAAFRRVDYEYPLALARLARAAGARHFLFVSALAANSRSFFFYNRVKGELEDAILSLGYPSVTIARPSLLLGERRERRLGEELAKKFSRVFPSPWGPVEARQVAAGLVRAALEDKPGVRILENVWLRKLTA